MKVHKATVNQESTVFDSTNDTARETSHFENVISSGYSAIIFNPTDADASNNL